LILKRIYIVLILWAVTCSCLHAETRYVSHSGTNTFPYTTWETAANTIEAANLATLPGDTMFIDTGSFYLSAPIYTQPKITMRGRGMDSTRILGSDSTDALLIAMFTPEDSNVVEDIHFIGHGSAHGFVKYATEPWKSFFCHRCKFSNLSSEPISFNKMVYVEIKDCWFETWESYALSLTERGDYVIENNTFDPGQTPWAFFDFMFAIGKKYIRNNIFIGGGQGGISGGSSGSMELTNNIFYNNPKLWLAVSAGENDIVVANNTIRAAEVALQISGYHLKRCLVYNNIFSGGTPVIHFVDDIPVDADIRIMHNCFYTFQPYLEYALVTLNNDSLHLDSAYANFRGDPMFVDPSIGDHHLQAGSPCIDAGAPWILDPDGSRSDMGAFGGPGGAVYAYVDYPPKSPSEFSAWRTGSQVVLSWYRNRESDLSYYILFRSEQSPVELDTSHVLTYLSTSGKEIGEPEPTKHLLPVGDTASPPDRALYDGFIPLATPENLVSVFYCDDTAEPNRDYYYLVVAVDSSWLVSAPSNEAAVTSLSADDVAVLERAELPIIEQNYPNPFNAVTAIVYNLPNLGAQPAPVELTIYNILGQVVRRLVNDRQFPGKHIAYWDGSDDGGQPVASGVYLYQLRASGIDFIENRKMIALK
jgi:hypothetical protein